MALFPIGLFRSYPALGARPADDAVGSGAASNWRRTSAAAICSLGGMTFGYDLGALSGATQGLMQSFALSPTLFGLMMSASLWGALCSSLIAGRIADRLGRRGLLAVCACLYGLAAGGLGSPISLQCIVHITDPGDNLTFQSRIHQEDNSAFAVRLLAVTSVASRSIVFENAAAPNAE